MTNHYTDVCEETIKSLRQQLAAKDAEIERLKTVPMKYRRMAFNAQLQNENAQLRQQLAEALAACKTKDELHDGKLSDWLDEIESLRQRPSEWKTNDELRKQLAELLDWQQKAFAAHPSIDMDIDHLKGGN